METFQERGSERGLCVLHSQVKPSARGQTSALHNGSHFGVVVDLGPPRALKLGKPIRVGIIGAGAAGRASVLQLVTPRRDTPCTGGNVNPGSVCEN